MIDKAILGWAGAASRSMQGLAQAVGPASYAIPIPLVAHGRLDQLHGHALEKAQRRRVDLASEKHFVSRVHHSAHGFRVADACGLAGGVVAQSLHVQGEDRQGQLRQGAALKRDELRHFR